MPSLDLTADEKALLSQAGAATFLGARRRVLAGEVRNVSWAARNRMAKAVVQEQGRDLEVEVWVETAKNGTVNVKFLACDCPGVVEFCEHAVATVLAALPSDRTSIRVGGEARRRAGAQRGRTPAWEKALAKVVLAGEPEPETEAGAEEMALQVITSERKDGSLNVQLRLVKRLSSGKWGRAAESWHSLRWRHWGSTSAAVADHQVTLLEELQAILNAGERYYAASETLSLLEACSRRVWDLLAELQSTGFPVVSSKGGQGALVHPEPVEAVLRAERVPAGLDLRAKLQVDGHELDLPHCVLIGSPAHGLLWREGTRVTEGGPLHLAGLLNPILDDVASVLAHGALHVPAKDEARFRQEYLPVLARRAVLVSEDPDLRPPEPEPPELTLTVTAHPGHVLDVHRGWVYRLGSRQRRLSLYPARPDEERDRPGEREVLDAVMALPLPEWAVQPGSPPRLTETAKVWGVVTAEFVEHLLPALKDVSGVNVVEVGEVGKYEELQSAPSIRFESAPGVSASGQEDWFDLAVEVTVGGHSVPFALLFMALARGDRQLLLPSGGYFSLDREEYRKLAELIAEARGLAEVEPGGSFRVTRYQADVWAELDSLGVIEGQAEGWRDRVRALTDAGELAEAAVPRNLQAPLRPYQEQGYQWLCALHARGLGGILADDMGLGKTVQTLAFLLGLKERGELAAPALVVGPTTLITNWANEAARFAPDLRVVTITESEKRRGAALAAAVADADLVITSYTLFRLEYDDYERLPWSALFLDEAQFVKNHTARGHQLAKKLPAAFKVAITGTPMENTLMELWALFAITAPGLFPSPKRFAEHFRDPIEREGDDDRLALLRRRVRPLMLRRTKALVAAELPEKQEQVLELELEPKHRQAYQRHLNRERQKVLGLLEDVNQNRFEIFRSLTLLRQAALDVGLVDPASTAPSTKLEALMTLVQDAVSEGHTVIVFSQFTRFLGAARDRIAEAGIPYAYLDGRTRDREKVLTRFRDGEAPVFLISLKAGGFGLNLTEADHCIVLDPWWNPASEAQAVDRIHRIGQTRKVLVHRLVVKDTIEDKVMALKARKAALFAGVLEDGSFENVSLDASDIRDLLSD